MRIAWALFAATCLLVGRASSEPVEIGQIAQGAVYYNRPGATLAAHNFELSTCLHETLSPGDGKPGTLSLGPASDLAGQMIWDGPIAGLQAAKVENCMLVRGWRAVRLPDPEGTEVVALSAADMDARVTPWIGAATPHGEIVRAFGNEAAHPTAYKTASRPAHPDQSQLSLRLNENTGKDRSPLIRPQVGKIAQLDHQWPKGSLKPAELSKAPAGSALIVARVTGISNRWGTGIVLTREGSTPEARPNEDDHAPDVVFASTGWAFAKKDGNWFVLAVPPGRWRIASSGFVNYCLGSPSFEVKPGEVVYAGTFHLNGDDLGPDLNVEPAKAYLGAPAADRLQPAAFRNGSRSSCHGLNLIYALEFPGAPFAPTYDWGGAMTTHR